MKINSSFIADTAFRERSSDFSSKLNSLAVTINSKQCIGDGEMVQQLRVLATHAE